MTIPKAAHNYQTTVTPPTCTEQGYTTHTCSVCGDSYKDSYTDALDHAWDDGIVTKPATETEIGIWTFTCTRCGATRTEPIPATGHTHNYTETVVAPTCTEQGYTLYTCVCGDSYEDNYTAALGHDYVNGVCSRCGEKDPDYTALCAPVITLSNVASSGKIKISWETVDGADSYQVYCSTSKTGKYTCLKTVTKTSFTNTGAVAGNTYYYKVRAVAGSDHGPFSTVKSRTCDLAQPVVKASNVASSGKVKLTWAAIDGAAKYEVYRATAKAGPFTRISTTTKTQYVNTSAKAGTTYYYKVRAIHSNTNANSAYSAVITRTCHLPQPVVSGTHVASSGKNKLTWEAVEGAKEYKVYRAASKTESYSLMKTTTELSYTNTGAEAGKTYYYKVKAIHKKSAANSSYSSVKTLTCDLPRPEVTISRTSGLPKLTWKAVSGAKQYKVYRASSKTSSYSLKYTGTAKAFIDAEAVSGKTYYYKVKAIHKNTEANSAYSAVVSIKATK